MQHIYIKKMFIAGCFVLNDAHCTQCSPLCRASKDLSFVLAHNYKRKKVHAHIILLHSENIIIFGALLTRHNVNEFYTIIYCDWLLNDEISKAAQYNDLLFNETDDKKEHNWYPLFDVFTLIVGGAMAKYLSPLW